MYIYTCASIFAILVSIHAKDFNNFSSKYSLLKLRGSYYDWYLTSLTSNGLKQLCVTILCFRIWNNKLTQVITCESPCIVEIILFEIKSDKSPSVHDLRLGHFGKGAIHSASFNWIILSYFSVSRHQFYNLPSCSG